MARVCAALFLLALVVALAPQPIVAQDEMFESDAACREFCQQFFPAATSPSVLVPEVGASFQFCFEYVCSKGRRTARCRQITKTKAAFDECEAAAEELAQSMCAPPAGGAETGGDMPPQDKYCSPGDCIQRVCRPDTDNRPRP